MDGALERGDRAAAAGMAGRAARTARTEDASGDRDPRADRGRRRNGCARVADDPRRDAELLLAARARAEPRVGCLRIREERILDCDATDRYESHVTRRALGEPVAYILGEKEFWSLPLAVTPRRAGAAPGDRAAWSNGRSRTCRERRDGRGPRSRDRQRRDRARHRARASVPARCSARTCPKPAIDAGRRECAAARACECVGFRRATGTTPVADERFDLIVCNPPYVAEDDPRVVPGRCAGTSPRARCLPGRPASRRLQSVVAGAPRTARPRAAGSSSSTAPGRASPCAVCSPPPASPG